MDTFSQVLLTLSFLLTAIVLIWAIGIFIWGVRTGGNWRNPVAMFEYFANLFFYRLRYNHQQRKRAYHKSVIKVPAAPDRVSIMSKQEERFFFLHEAGLEAKVDLNEVNGEVAVTKSEFKRLQDFFRMTSKVSTPHAAFAEHGLKLHVQSAAGKVQKQVRNAQ